MNEAYNIKHYPARLLVVTYKKEGKWAVDRWERHPRGWVLPGGFIVYTLDEVKERYPMPVVFEYL